MMTLEEIWRRYDAVESRLTAPLSDRMLDLAGLQSGMPVLDLATGRGEPALRAARRVGPQGVVLGVELSAALLKIAKENGHHDQRSVMVSFLRWRQSRLQDRSPFLRWDIVGHAQSGEYVS